MVLLENDAELEAKVLCTEDPYTVPVGLDGEASVSLKSCSVQFLTELTRMFVKTKTSGTVYITMKRYEGRTKPDPRPSKAATAPSLKASEFKCLFHATVSNRKISTIVNSKDITKFQLAYASVLKGNVDGLKKKDKKTKATQ